MPAPHGAAWPPALTGPDHGLVEAQAPFDMIPTGREQAVREGLSRGPTADPAQK
jgi:hypothetical protein